ncbi:MAG: DUF4199 domain-containing protein [Sediminibacterium sp.]
MKPNLNQSAITYGVITGLIFLALNFGGWAMVSTDTYVSIIGITTFVPYVIVTLIIAGIKLRKQNDNLLTFAEALKFTFLAYVIYALIEAVGNYVLYAIVDKDLTAKVMEISLAKTQKMMEAFGASEQQMEEAMARAQKEPPHTSFKQVFLGLGIGLIWNFVKSLLISLVIRREPKFEDQL